MFDNLRIAQTSNESDISQVLVKERACQKQSLLRRERFLSKFAEGLTVYK